MTTVKSNVICGGLSKISGGKNQRKCIVLINRFLTICNTGIKSKNQNTELEYLKHLQIYAEYSNLSKTLTIIFVRRLI